MTLPQRILAALLLLLLFAVTSQAQAEWVDDFQPSRDSLKGLNGIVVKVDAGSIDALPTDPTERELQAIVEQRLTDAGIRVLKRPHGQSDNSPTLVVDVFFINFDIFYCQMSIHASLRQEVSLPANPSLKLVASTWQWGGGGIEGGNSKRDDVGNVVDKFICDFRRVNPEIKGPLPDCIRLEDSSDHDKPHDNEPTVMTELEDQLIHAAALNELADVRALLVKGADVNAHDHADSTPLYYAVRSGNRKVGDSAVVEELLKRGANPNLSLSCRLTPLMNAVDRHDVKIVQLLLAHGADVNATTHEGYTALMAAAMLGFPDLVSSLLTKGAKADAKSQDGQTALTFARRNMNTIAAADRPAYNPPYSTRITEADLLKQARRKHARVIQLLGQRTMKPR
jgi:hypothetical protein